MEGPLYVIDANHLKQYNNRLSFTIFLNNIKLKPIALLCWSLFMYRRLFSCCLYCLLRLSYRLQQLGCLTVVFHHFGCLSSCFDSITSSYVEPFLSWRTNFLCSNGNKTVTQLFSERRYYKYVLVLSCWK